MYGARAAGRFLLVVAVLSANLLWTASCPAEPPVPPAEEGASSSEGVLDFFGSSYGRGEGRGGSATEDPDRKIETVRARADALTARLTAMEREWASLAQKRDAVEKDFLDGQEKAELRLVTLYKFNYLGYMAPLLGVEDLSAAVDAVYAIKRLFQNDSRMHFQLSRKLTEIRSLDRLLEKNKQDRQELEQELKTQQKRLAALGEEKSIALARVNGRKEEPPRRQPGETEAGGGSSIVQTPEGDAVNAFLAAETLDGLQGALPLPTAGSVLETFGAKNHSPSRTILYNNGIIIQAPKGQPVQAIHGGRVVFADWFKDYGKVMIVDHGGRYLSLIAHADQLLKTNGDMVKPGETIATVGDTGSQDGSKLYFELRHHGRPVNPMEWLAVNKTKRE